MYTNESDKPGCPFCGKQLHVVPFDPSLISCLQLPRQLLTESYHEFNYMWNVHESRIERLSLSFLINKSPVSVVMYREEKIMQVYSKDKYLFTVPKLIVADFPNLSLFKEKIKKYILFS